MTRRTFMQFAGGTMLYTGGQAWAGANNRVRVAVIGIHGMGQNHIREYAALPDVDVAALCDVDANLFGPVIKKHFTDKGLKPPKTYTDLRKLYEDPEIDAVSIVTPNHWHTLAAIWAIQAGKHVSVEKPCCHNIYEGGKLVEAAKKYRVIVQDGAEQRSNPCAQSMAAFLHNGGLGEVYMAKGICYKWRNTIGRFPDETPPDGVDYDLWLGPAPRRPFNRNRFHYNWHWNWDYGNGDMGNQGVHEMDIARWGLGVKLPTKITAVGGHMMFDDAQETPNVLMALFEFPNPAGGGDKKKILQFEVRHWVSNGEDGMWLKGAKQGNDYMATSAGNVTGNLFFGSKGYMVKDVNRWRTCLGEKREPGESGSGIGNHYQNFITAIRSGDPQTFNRSIEEGFYSCALIHLGNIAYRLGRTLTFDPDTLRFPGDEEANAMLTREYRAPFVVPDKV
ncbi:MAG TPA: Gfo/Idh/MocA family oxidoreductase [Kiritimatiellia bacterium]|nr:Gfo/Idh/MocA family oxidoreductase [Kiritimatiellia bacterium]HRU70367.1 Gfo/Idh/MocA family oxidoreductase [Kiritimatiellia bacterium]